MGAAVLFELLNREAASWTGTVFFVLAWCGRLSFLVLKLLDREAASWTGTIFLSCSGFWREGVGGMKEVSKTKKTSPRLASLDRIRGVWPKKPQTPRFSSHTSLFWTLPEQISTLYPTCVPNLPEPMSQDTPQHLRPQDFHLTHPCFELCRNRFPYYTPHVRQPSLNQCPNGLTLLSEPTRKVAVFELSKLRNGASATPKQQGPEGRTGPADNGPNCLTLLSEITRKVAIF